MTSWDVKAAAHLKTIAVQQRRDGVVEMMHEIIGHVWNGNVDRFEPGVMGDTNKSLGGTAAENISTLTLRTMVDPRRWDLSDAVRAGAPQGSLLVAARGINMHVVKAPATKVLRNPDFDAFSWTGGSETRAAAANANALKYNPWVGPGSLFEGLIDAKGSAEALTEVFLVWAGGSDAPNTAGWLGVPTTGDRPWLAVEQLWWDETGTGPSRRLIDTPQSSAGASFSDGTAPELQVQLKPRPKTAEQ
jgi:hypothetical protein